MTTALQLDVEACNSSFMGTTKISADWKFWMQLAVLLLAIGGGLQANSAMQLKVEQLEKSNAQKTEIILRMEGKFDLLNLQIQQLKERLEAKKIVNATAFDPKPIATELYTQR